MAPFAFLLLLCLLGTIFGLSYKDSEEIPVLVSKVGPVDNPSETYRYSHLPLCQRSVGKDESKFADELVGSRNMISPVHLRFKVNVTESKICSFTYSAPVLNKLDVAVHRDYYVEYIIDEIPFSVFLGARKNEDTLFGHSARAMHYINTNLHLVIGYNKNNVIYIDARARAPIEIKNQLAIDYTLTVEWVPSSVPVEHRAQLIYKMNSVHKNVEIHWIFIINTIILVIILVVYVLYILVNNLRNDFAVSALMDEEDMVGIVSSKNIGWKHLYGDVFRRPSALALLSGLLGNGAQFLVVAITTVVFCQLNTTVALKKSNIVVAILLLYCFTMTINGYVTQFHYTLFGGVKHLQAGILSLLLFTVPTILLFFVMNSTAVANLSTAALPFFTILTILALYFFIGIPLYCLGSYLFHRNREENLISILRVKKISRQIPECIWYHQLQYHVILGGIIPFSAIYVELYYIFSAMWGRQYYTFFGILAMTLLLLILVTSLVTMCLLYYSLNAENHHWHWRSLLVGGATGFVFLIYCFIYYNKNTNMHGTLQGIFFFGYMFLISYVVFLILGFVGYFTSLFFVKYIYASIKYD